MACGWHFLSVAAVRACRACASAGPPPAAAPAAPAKPRCTKVLSEPIIAQLETPISVSRLSRPTPIRSRAFHAARVPVVASVLMLLFHPPSHLRHAFSSSCRLQLSLILARIHSLSIVGVARCCDIVTHYRHCLSLTLSHAHTIQPPTFRSPVFARGSIAPPTSS